MLSWPQEERIEDSEDYWRRSLPEFLEFLKQYRCQEGGFEAVEWQDGGRVLEKEVFIG
jgi:hypothetical protein